MLRTLVCLTMLTALTVQTLDAQCRRGRCRDEDQDRGRRTISSAPEFGVHGGYDFDEELGMAGGQLRIPVADQVFVVPSGDVFFDDALTEWQLNADVVLRPEVLGGVYIGAGAAFVNRDFDRSGEDETETGYNLFAGLDGGQLLRTSIRPYVEARWTDVDDYDPFRAVIGVNVPVATGRRR